MDKIPGKLIIFSAPSGAGKTSIVKALLARIPGLAFSVSACSRPMRPNEENGRDYYFLTPEAFRARIAQGDFLEWEEVYPGSFYGTLRSEVYRLWDAGKHVIFDVDVVGGLNIKRQFPDSSLAIFVQPPSLKELEKRLLLRGTETAESLKKRIGKAQKEMKRAVEFDVSVVNDKLDEAILQAEQLINNFLLK